MGSLYRRRHRDGTAGRIYWAKYYVNGRPVRETTGTDKETEARRFLKEREGRAAVGQAILPRAARVRYEEVARDLREHYQATGARNLKEAETRLQHLDRFFQGRRVAALSQMDATAYVLKRHGDDVSNATINRELAILTKMLRLAYETSKLVRIPVIRKLKENAPRQGFFEREQFEAVRRRLRPDLQTASAIAYTYGWRMQSEVLALERRQVDLQSGTLRLDPGTTKNNEGRIVYLTPELKALLAAQLERVERLSKQNRQIIPYIFPHLTGRRAGTQRGDFRKAWSTACQKAGVPGMLRHDLRRTAVRNMVNAGVPELVAMKVTGHKTRSVFDRYHIVSPGDLQDVARRLAGTFSGTPRHSEVAGRSLNSDNPSTRP